MNPPNRRTTEAAIEVYHEQIRAVQMVMADFVHGRPRLNVLEAGCGSAAQVRLGPDARVTGIDISMKQLARNPVVTERIQGDIQFSPFAAEVFDLIVCWEVLEHVARPVAALQNFVQALAPGGMLLLALPNVRSIKGLVTKYTPYTFHLWVYRNLLGKADAGHDDNGPFPTYARDAIAPDRLRDFAMKHQLCVIYRGDYESPGQRILRQRCRLVERRWELAKKLLRTLGGGLVEPEQTEVILVLQKPLRSAQP